MSPIEPTRATDKPDEPEYWYRYDERHNSFGGTIIELRRFKVVKNTPTGARLLGTTNLDVNYNTVPETFFVCRNWRKKYASPSVKEALSDFIARKRVQLAIYEGKARNAHKALMIALGEPDSFEGRVETESKWKKT